MASGQRQAGGRRQAAGKGVVLALALVVMVALVALGVLRAQWPWAAFGGLIGLVGVAQHLLAGHARPPAAPSREQRKVKVRSAAASPAAPRGATAAPRGAGASSSPAATPAPPPAPAHPLQRAIACIRQVTPKPVPEGQRVKVNRPAGSPEDDEPLVRTACSFFLVCYRVEAPGEPPQFATRGQLREAGLTLDELHALAVRNLAALTQGRMTLQSRGGSHRVALDGQYEASLALVDELWDGPFKLTTPGGAAVALPAGDTLAFCDARDAEGVADLRRLLADAGRGGQRLLDDRLFLRQGGRWEELPSAQQELAPLEFKL